MSLTHDTPLGTLVLAASDAGLTRCAFVPGGTGRAGSGAGEGGSAAAHRWLDVARRELDAFFTGELQEFTVPADLGVLPELDRLVLGRLERIGHGRTVTYRGLAVMSGLGPQDARLVGGVMSRNPVLIVVPCHRVVGTNGSLVGYSGGVAAKRRLLDLEGGEPALVDPGSPGPAHHDHTAPRRGGQR